MLYFFLMYLRRGLRIFFPENMINLSSKRGVLCFTKKTRINKKTTCVVCKVCKGDQLFANFFHVCSSCAPQLRCSTEGCEELRYASSREVTDWLPNYPRSSLEGVWSLYCRKCQERGDTRNLAFCGDCSLCAKKGVTVHSVTPSGTDGQAICGECQIDHFKFFRCIVATCRRQDPIYIPTGEVENIRQERGNHLCRNCYRKPVYYCVECERFLTRCSLSPFFFGLWYIRSYPFSFHAGETFLQDST